MDRSDHSMACLFAQLGINSSPTSFIRKHKAIPENVELANASMWNESQAEFLRSAIEQDSDWAEIVDTLNCLLR